MKKIKSIIIFSMLIYLFCSASVIAYGSEELSTAEQYIEFIKRCPDDGFNMEYTEPNKTEYIVGEEIDLTGGSITLIANKGTEEEERLNIPYTSKEIYITGFYDMNTPGTYFISVVFDADLDSVFDFGLDLQCGKLYIYVNEANENEDELNNNIECENIKNYVVTKKENLDTPWLKKLYNIDSIQIPDKFNLAEMIDIEVKNQGNKGLCYLFTLLKSAETNVVLKHGKKYNFSASYVDYMTSNLFYGFRDLKEDGMSVEIFMQWAANYGLALEEEIPYKEYSESEYDDLKNATIVSKIKSTISFPGIIKENSVLYKSHIMQYGSLALVVPTPDRGTEYFNSETQAYYYKAGMPYSRGTHAVSLIGWDDDYPKENFNIEPEHDGAWIAMNSWGDDWGNKGIFYISYDDEGIYGNIDSATFGVIETGNIYERIEHTHSDFANANKKVYASNDRDYNNIVMPYNKKTFFSVEFEKNNDVEYLDSIYLSNMLVTRERSDEIICCKFYIVDNYDGTNISDYSYLGEARCD